MATLTINLSKPDMDLLGAISARKGMTKTAVLRQALRLYQNVVERVERGEKVFTEGNEIIIV